MMMMIKIIEHRKRRVLEKLKVMATDAPKRVKVILIILFLETQSTRELNMA